MWAAAGYVLCVFSFNALFCGGQLENTESGNGNGILGASLVPRANSALMPYTEGIGTALVRQWEANGGKL